MNTGSGQSVDYNLLTLKISELFYLDVFTLEEQWEKSILAEHTSNG